MENRLTMPTKVGFGEKRKILHDSTKTKIDKLTTYLFVSKMVKQYKNIDGKTSS